jgi:hypothetical protein
MLTSERLEGEVQYNNGKFAEVVNSDDRNDAWPVCPDGPRV